MGGCVLSGLPGGLIVTMLCTRITQYSTITGFFFNFYFICRESKDFYTILVTATDSDSATATTTVEVTVLDINDEVPQIQNDE